MEERNKYGFVSGGWIFDYMDRKALETLNRAFGDTSNKNYFTASAKIKYIRQMCDTKCIQCGVGIKFITGRKCLVHVVLAQDMERKAEADFIFVEAKENKCKIKA